MRNLCKRRREKEYEGATTYLKYSNIWFTAMVHTATNMIEAGTYNNL